MSVMELDNLGRYLMGIVPCKFFLSVILLAGKEVKPQLCPQLSYEARCKQY